MTGLTGVEVGQLLPGFTRILTRADLVRYAGASGDFNPIHWSDAAASELGLPNVIAHGMLTMGTALRVVTDWAGDPARLRSYYVRFTKDVYKRQVQGELRHRGAAVAGRRARSGRDRLRQGRVGHQPHRWPAAVPAEHSRRP